MKRPIPEGHLRAEDFGIYEPAVIPLWVLLTVGALPVVIVGLCWLLTR